MPKVADPAQWKEARRRWETTEMSYSEIAAVLNVSVPTVSLRARKELWLKGDVVQLDKINYSPREMVEISIRALVRAANQTYDIASAVKASGMLLDRALGKVAAEQTVPLLPPEASPEEPQEGMLPPPPWLDQSKRLAYQAGEPSQGHSQIASPIGNTVLPRGTQGVIRD